MVRCDGEVVYGVVVRFAIKQKKINVSNTP